MDPYLLQLESVYMENRRELYACALAVTRCPDRAEDAIHDAFRGLAESRPEAANLNGYVFRAVRNAAIDQLRRAGPPAVPLNGTLFEPAHPGPDPAKRAADNQFAANVSAALDRLTDDERETIVAHLWGGQTFKAIAAARSAPPGTVASWYRRGIERLRLIVKE